MGSSDTNATNPFVVGVDFDSEPNLFNSVGEPLSKVTH